MLLPFVIFAVLLVLTLLIVLYLLYPGVNKVSTIPGLDPSSEVEGNYPDIQKAGSFTEFLTDLHERFGPIASFWMGKEFVVTIRSPELFKEVSHLFDRPALLFKYVEPLLGKQSIQYANGPEGMARRRMHDHSFSHDKLVKKLGLFQEIANEVSEKWKSMCDTKQHVPLSTHMCGAVMKVLTRFAYGDYFKDEKNVLSFRKDYDLSFGILEESMISGHLKPGSEEEKKMMEAVARLRATVTSIVRDREKREISPDDQVFLDTLLDKYDNEDMLLDDSLTFLIAGFHTTAFYLVWALYFLGSHPDVQEKCYEDIKANFLPSQPADWDKMKEMKYLLQTMSEIHRMSRLAAFAARYSTQDMMLGGHKVPGYTPIVTALSCMMMDKTVWEDPENFDPNHFKNPEKIPRYAFEPFGFAGKRKCPGYRMSDYESQVMLMVLLSKFKVKLVPGQVITEVYQLVTKPAEEVWVTLEARE